MAQTLRRLKPLAALAPLSLLWLGPFMLALISMAVSLTAADVQAFWSVPHVIAQAALSVAIGTVSTVAAAAFALWLAVSLPNQRHSSLLGSYLAVPHLAFAVGLAFLIMPAGLLPRLFFETPPQWATVQDPHGIALTAALILKEVPFLLWLMHAMLKREDFSKALEAQKRVSLSLGHGNRSTAWRITAPQLLSQLAWPLVIVWVYGCTVVDMALIIGPAQPSPLQISIWHDLNNADPAIESRGLAGVVVLTAVLAALVLVAAAAWRSTRTVRRAWLVRGPDAQASGSGIAPIAQALLGLVYAMVVLVLLMLSFTQRWPFPSLLPEAMSSTAWLNLLSDRAPVLNSLWLAASTAAVSLLLAVLWFECCAARWDKALGAAAVAALTLPAIALAAGQYRFMLRLGLNGTAAGVWLAQLVPVFAYVFLTLVGPYRAFDQRYRSAAHSLGRSNWPFLTRVKWPLLKGPLASAAAIACAVSLAQYVSVQLVGAGNLATLTTEAVTLASGGNRAVLAAYALALTAFTGAGFGLSAWIGARRGT